MNFFNFFSKEKQSEEIKPMTLALPVTESEPAIESIESDSEVKNEGIRPTLSVTYATGWPIDVIYGYLRKDYSDQGYNDAMVKSDLTFRDMNLRIIKNRILMTFREVGLNYDVMYRSLDTKIQTCAQAGLLSTVSELEQQKAIIEAHKQELEELESSFTKGSNDATIALQSYECGFLKGLASIMLGSANRKVTPIIGETNNNLSTAIA